MPFLIVERVGKADVTGGLIASMGLGVEYPSDSNAFLLASTHATTLLPTVRFQLASERSDPFGAAGV